MLTKAEQQELAYLEKEFGEEKSPLTPAEQQEMEALELSLMEEQGDDLGWGIVEDEPERTVSHAPEPKEVEAGNPIPEDEKLVESKLGAPKPKLYSPEAMSLFEQALAAEEAYLNGQEEDSFGKAVDESLAEADIEAAVADASDWSFYKKIGEFAETDHGDTPVDTNDSSEAGQAVKSKDVGYGHKVKASEIASKQIHGIPFIDANGDYIPLTMAQKEAILEADMKSEVELALEKGWAEKLGKLGASWEHLSQPYQQALTSLAFNTGGDKAGKQWTKVLEAALNKDVEAFAKELRRKDGGNHTHGMDNRVAKELFFSGLIKSLDEVSTVIPLATTTSGVPLKETV